MSAVHAILILLIRLWAVSAALNFLSGAIQFVFMLLEASDPEEAFSKIFVIHPLLWAVAAIAAWVAAPKLAQKVFKPNDAENIKIDIDAETLITVGSFLIGAFILVEHAPQMLIKITTYFIEGIWPGHSTPIAILKFLFRQVATEALIVVFALYLVLRPAKLSAMFSNLRTAGLSSAQDNESNGEGK